jgi:hypothetical protein
MKYYGKNFGIVKYSNSADRHRNIIVVGDSYDNCIEKLLASHYKDTYFVDLRNYNKEVGEPFDMDQFLVDNRIDDILFFGDPETVLGIPVP